MTLTEEQALKLGKKVMSDIGFEYDQKDEITTKYDDGKILEQGINIWLVSFQYGKEDYGRNVGVNVSIYDNEKLAVSVSYRNGFIALGYNAEKDKYFVKSKRP